MLANILLVINIIAALALIGLVLIQHGKGADAGAAFGSGASSTVFGARGSQTFLSQATKYTAVVWFVVTMALVYITRHSGSSDRSVVDSAPTAEVQTAPAPSTALPSVTPATAPATGTGGG